MTQQTFPRTLVARRDPVRAEERIAGYRILRWRSTSTAVVEVNGEPAELQLYTARSFSEGQAPSAGAGNDGQDRDLGLTLPEDDLLELDHRLHSMSMLTTRHVRAVIDCARVHAGVVVVVRGGTALSEWLTPHHSLRLGELITILAPITATLSRAHNVGIAGIALTIGDITIDAEGAPMLSFRGARQRTERSTPAWRASNTWVHADRRAMLALAEQLFECTLSADTAEAKARFFANVVDDSVPIDRFESFLLELGDALPLSSAPTPATPKIPNTRRSRRISSIAAEESRHEVARRSFGWLRPVPSFPPAKEVASALLFELRRVRRPVWLLAASAAVSAACVAVVLPAIS
ncbi:hypothetical protein [Humidisolicoccus flavus]|uniref:hypothetical protein n=1 Tax=Humidisolicoccus flavus TaxID=3111414 RepID=UPI0032544EC2